VSDEFTESPEFWFHKRATHYVETQILFHLGQAGVFNLLDDEGPLSVRVIASKLNLVPHVLSCLLDYVINVDDIIEYDNEGRVSVTKFGESVLIRYGRKDVDQTHFNFFDVRVGAYGPVWQGLDRLLSGENRYGKELVRSGEHAAVGVYKVSAMLIDQVEAALLKFGVSRVAEIGVPSGLLALLKSRQPQLEAVGVDVSELAIAEGKVRAVELGVDDISWRQADFFDTGAWGDLISDGSSTTAIVSTHFHELVGEGVDSLQEALGELKRKAPGTYVLAIEQERLGPADKDRVSDTVWSYSHSNVLIHHLIKNGQIFARSRWIEVFEEGGCTLVSADPMGYLGYHLYLFRL